MDLSVRHEPHPAPEISAASAFALMLETACQQFEVLLLMVQNKIQLSSAEQRIPPANCVDAAFAQSRISRPEGCIRMALAKSFVANTIRARRICEHGAEHLAVERLERRRFLKATEGVLQVRDVNEHGFDANVASAAGPKMHYQHGGYTDETSMAIFGPDKILMGPLNLCNVYPSVARMRDRAGFSSLERVPANRNIGV